MGIRLYDNDYVVGMEVVPEDKDMLFVTEGGFGKRVRVADFRIAHRGGYGVRTIPTEGRNGQVIGLAIVDDTVMFCLSIFMVKSFVFRQKKFAPWEDKQRVFA